MIERLGRYEVIRLVGSGNQGTVYMARDPELDRVVAIKVMNHRVDNDPDYLVALRREASLAAGLQHPNVTTIYDIQLDSDPPFIVMEYVPDSLLNHIGKGERLPWRRAVEVTLQVARALEHAHLSGIVHRDIKPANILLRESGDVAVSDFGIARAFSSSSQNIGSIAGTPMYMAPEQWSGGSVDGRLDQYALGIVFYEAISGYTPFEADSYEAYFVQHRETRVPRFSPDLDVPAALDEIVRRATEKEAGSRYASTADMVEALGNALKLDEVSEPDGPSDTPKRPDPAGPRKHQSVLYPLWSWCEDGIRGIKAFSDGIYQTWHSYRSLAVIFTGVAIIAALAVFLFSNNDGPERSNESQLSPTGVNPVDPEPTVVTIDKPTQIPVVVPDPTRDSMQQSADADIGTPIPYPKLLEMLEQLIEQSLREHVESQSKLGSEAKIDLDTSLVLTGMSSVSNKGPNVVPTPTFLPYPTPSPTGTLSPSPAARLTPTPYPTYTPYPTPAPKPFSTKVPVLATAHYYAGLTAFDGGSFYSAVSSFTSAIDLNPTYHEAYYDRSRAYSGLGLLDEASDDIKSAMVLDPENPTYPAALALLETERGDYRRALALYSVAIDLDDDWTHPWIWRGRSYQHIGDYESAMSDYDMAISLGEDGHIYYLRGSLYADQGYFRQALEDYDLAIDDEPNEPVYHALKGKMHEGLGETEPAFEAYRQAMQIDPGFSLAYDASGLLNLTLGRAEAAVQDYSRAIELRPDYIPGYTARAIGYSMMGQPELAFSDYDMAVRLEPDNARLYTKRAEFHGVLGREDDALEDMAMACSLDSQYCR